MTSFGTGSPIEKETAFRAKAGELLKRIAYEKDKVIFHEGHDGTDAYVLESGRVGVFKNTDGKSSSDQQWTDGECKREKGLNYGEHIFFHACGSRPIAKQGL